MEPDFWLNRWRAAQIGFHQQEADKHLKAYWPLFELPADCAVFVPLCGKSLDLMWLRERGHSVTGVELSPVALESFVMEHGIPARRRVLADFDVYEVDGFKLFRGDFFRLTHALLGNTPAIYDRAALISWEPSARAAYVKHLTSLTNPGTQMLLIVVEFPSEQMQGPPFPLTRDTVEKLYADHYSIEEVGRLEILELEPRLKARGLTELREVCYRMTRL